MLAINIERKLNNKSQPRLPKMQALMLMKEKKTQIVQNRIVFSAFFVHQMAYTIPIHYRIEYMLLDINTKTSTQIIHVMQSKTLLDFKAWIWSLNTKTKKRSRRSQ